MATLPRLIALSPGVLAPGGVGAFLAALEQACAAGLPGILLREPGLSDRAYLELARRVLGLTAFALTAPCRPWFGVHDRAHLAGELGADALHLSFRSLRPRELAWRPPGLALGLSTHGHDDPADWAGAEYLFHGPLRATPGKAVELEPLGLAGLARAAGRTAQPILALGGVTPADVRPLLAAGLHGVAVRAGILPTADPARATRAYLEALP